MSNVSVFEVDDATAPKGVPPLTIMSLSTRTVFHIGNNNKEILVASARIYTDGTHFENILNWH